MATNFQSITESPEKLAEFINEILTNCAAPRYTECEGCPLNVPCNHYEGELVEWLQEEAADD